MQIEELQKQQQEEHYQYIKNAIIDNVKRYIKQNPYSGCLDYYNNGSFLVRRKSGLPEPIWIYSHIERYFDRLVDDLRCEGIEICKVKNYEIKTKGFFKKKEYKEFKNECFKLSW